MLLMFWRACLCLLFAAGLVAAAVEVPIQSAVAAPATVADAPSAPDEESAARIARTYGHDVVADESTTTNEQVVAQADGTFRLEVSSEPVRVRQGETWAPIDLTLQPTADGGLAPATSTTEVRFSGGGSDAEVGAILGPDGTWSTQSWTAGTLPAPVIAGDTATYAEVYPGVDLKMTATISGFSQVLVIKTPAAAANADLRTVRLELDADKEQQSTAAGAGMDLATDARLGVHVGAATWWDSTTPGSSADGPGGSGLERAVPTQMSETEIAIDTTSVTSKPNLTYPVYVDPAYGWEGAIAGGTAYTFVDKTFPTAGYWNGSHPDRYQHVGYVDSAHGGPDTARAFWRMTTNGVKGKHVISAEFNTVEVWASSCNPSPVELYSTGGISTGTTWNAQPAWGTKLDTRSFAYGWSSTGTVGGPSTCTAGGSEAGFQATSAVVAAAKAKADYVTLGLRVPTANESDWKSWKKFRAGAKLAITYNSYPNVPFDLHASGGIPCVRGAGRPSIGSLPYVYATATDPDGDTLAVNFEWWKTGGDPSGQASTAYLASGTMFHAQIPSSAFLDGANVSYRARAYDRTDWNLGYSNWCEFHLDKTAPSKPTVSSADDQFPQGEQPVKSVGDEGYIDIASGGVPDVTAYYVSINGRPATREVPNTVGGPLSMKIKPGLPSSWVEVYSVDAANNKSSDSARYDFRLKPSLTLKAEWTVTGDNTFDPDGRWKSATANPAFTYLTPKQDLTVTSSTADGQTITDDGVGPVIDTDSISRFQFHTDGINDYAETSTSALNTNASYTIAATVRPDPRARGTYQTVVAQGGTTESAFYLQFDPAGNMRFVVTSADSTNRSAVIASASSADVLDDDKCGAQRTSGTNAGVPYDPEGWNTIIGVYDKIDNQVQLWISGCTKPLAQVAGPAGVWAATGPLLVGTARQGGKASATNMYRGGIADVVVFAGAATSDEIMKQLGEANA